MATNLSKMVSTRLRRLGMTREEKIEALEQRKRVLLVRGPHNLKLAAKIDRKIRKLSTEEK